MENTIKNNEMSLSDLLGESGSVLPERSLMRHRRRALFESLSGAFADNGSVANSSSVNQVGLLNSNTTTQSGTVLNIL